MKKTLSLLAILGMVAVGGAQSVNAFTWSDLNPANWGNSHCPKCEKKKNDCGCKKIKECDPCNNIPTGAAAPCDPCLKKSPCSVPVQQPCEPCQKLQQMNR